MNDRSDDAVRATPELLERVRSELANGSTALEDVARSGSISPNAGESTTTLAETLGLVLRSSAGVLGGLRKTVSCRLVSHGERGCMPYEDDWAFTKHEPPAPAVLGPEHVPHDDDAHEEHGATGAPADEVPFPPVVYVPCETASPKNGELSLDLRRMRDGRMALLVYSNLARLVQCCGQQQPWVALRTEKLDEIDKKIQFDVILLDVEIPSEFRR